MCLRFLQAKVCCAVLYLVHLKSPCQYSLKSLIYGGLAGTDVVERGVGVGGGLGISALCLVFSLWASGIRHV